MIAVVDDSDAPRVGVDGRLLLMTFSEGVVGKREVVELLILLLMRIEMRME